jgi:hypothetical protein
MDELIEELVNENDDNFYKVIAHSSFLVFSLIWLAFNWSFYTELILLLPQLFCADWLSRYYKIELIKFSTEYCGFGFAYPLWNAGNDSFDVNCHISN